MGGRTGPHKKGEKKERQEEQAHRAWWGEGGGYLINSDVTSDGKLGGVTDRASLALDPPLATRPLVDGTLLHTPTDISCLMFCCLCGPGGHKTSKPPINPDGKPIRHSKKDTPPPHDAKTTREQETDRQGAGDLLMGVRVHVVLGVHHPLLGAQGLDAAAHLALATCVKHSHITGHRTANQGCEFCAWLHISTSFVKET